METSATIFACIFGGALLGMWLRGVLPEHHLADANKDLIKLSAGLIGTMAALLLGLLVASAKGSYDSRRDELTQLAANEILLDRLLAHYGPETHDIRGGLKVALMRMIAQAWPEKEREGGITSNTGAGEVVFDEIQGLQPHSDSQRAMQSQAESMLVSMGQTRLLLFEQSGTSISTVFLVVVVFWITMLFVSFGLFAPANTTAIVTLLVSALSVAGALYLILELDHPFGGLIQLSSAPLRNALALLGR